MSSICVADYAEELRFYLIHMTEVRDFVRVCACVHVCVGVQEKEEETERKRGSNVNSLFGL